MAYYYTDVAYELELSAGVWTDVTADVIGVVKSSNGIHGWGHHDRIADTGTMTLLLKNDANKYTPNHISCLAGFQAGMHLRMKLTYAADTKYRYYGTVLTDGIKLSNKIGLAVTEVSAVDYMEQMTNHELWLPAYAQNKKLEEVIALVIANMPIAPLATSYGTGQDTFGGVFDTVKSKTFALAEVGKATQTEIGYVYLNQGATAEVLVSEGRDDRSGVALSQNSNAEDYVFDNSMRHYSITHGKEYANAIKVIAYPRKVDASATTVLFNLESPIAIEPGDTVTFVGRYVDPNMEAETVCGIDMVTPLVANTHFKFNTADDGSGTDISADLTITPTFGTNGTEWEATNGNANLGYIWFLQSVGKGVYIYRPVEYNVEDSTLVAADGRRLLTIDLMYQENPLVAVDVATVMLDLYKTKRTVIETVTFVANRSEFLLRAFKDIQIGDKIRVKITQTGTDEEYFVHSLDWTGKPGGFFEFTLGLKEASMDSRTFWEWGEVGFSEWGETTIWGF